MAVPNKKDMRSIFKLFTLCLTLALGTQLMAQDANKTLLQTERMAAKLDLTEAQKSALDKELKESRDAQKVKMEKMRALREEMRRDAFVERQAKEERLEAILTEDQMAKLKQSRKKVLRARVDGKDRDFTRSQGRSRGGESTLERRQEMRKRFQMRRKPAPDPVKKSGGGN